MPAIIYNSNGIIPTPLVTIRKVIEQHGDGRNKRKYFEITLNGTLHAYSGSPNSSGAFGINTEETITADNRLGALLAKQRAITNLFQQGGLLFEITPTNGQPTTFHPQIKEITFQEGIWFDVVKWSCVMTANTIHTGDLDWWGGSDDCGPSESWTIEVANENTRSYRVTHSISSQQLATYDDDGSLLKNGWEVARDIVKTRIGAALPQTLEYDIYGFTAGNYSRAETINQGDGSYQVIESYFYNPNGDYVEEFNINTRVNEGQVKVTVEGSVTGFSAVGSSGVWPQSVGSAKRYMAASGAFTTIQGNLLTRAQNYSGYSLNPSVLNKTKGDNPVAGVITYNYEFDNRPSSQIAGALSETITVNAKNPTDIFASIVVLGRLAGPVLQDIDTVTSSVKTVSIEAVMPPQTYGQSEPSPPSTNAIVAAYIPPGSVIFKNQDDENFAPRSGRYSRTVSWTFE